MITVVLLGEKGTGKSSFMYAVLTEEFPEEEIGHTEQVVEVVDEVGEQQVRLVDGLESDSLEAYLKEKGLS